MESTINNGMCRCCASEGTFKDVKSSYHWMGEEEIYSDMLRECFDVSLLLSEDGNDGGICEVCITQLRNAANFKKQVQHTEEQFKLRLDGKLYKSDSIVKIEPSRGEDDDNDSDNMSGDDFSGAEYEVPIKTEKLEETKPKKRPATSKPSTSRAKKTKNAEPETSTKRNLRSDRHNTKTNTTKTSDQKDRVKLKKDLNFSTFIVIKPTATGRMRNRNQSQPALEQKGRPKEIDFQFHNAKTILRCSNATPIRCRVGSRYACSYCLDQFPDPRELKIHTQAHSSSEKPEFLNTRSLSRYIVYLDITNLQCNLCEELMRDLDELIDHLRKEHNQSFHDIINNHIISFKFDGGDINMKCVVCGGIANDFDRLLEHMNTHYANYKCEFCEEGFVNRSMSIDHKRSMHNVMQKIKYSSRHSIAK